MGAESEAARASAAARPRAGRGLDSFALKLLAIVAMTCNHASYCFEAQLPFWGLTLLRGVGGLTFPTMAFLIVEGYHHTRSVRNYLLRLALFAALAQVPYTVFLAPGEVQANVLVTLFLGLLVIFLDDRLENRALFAVVVLAILIAGIWCDWGVIGPAMILLFKRLLNSRWREAPCLLPAATDGLMGLALLLDGDPSGLSYALYGMAACPLAISLLRSYNGKRGPGFKYFFYAYYPGHIVALGLIRLAVFGV